MYLGLDLGTSGLKGLLIDDQQKVVASVMSPLSVDRPQSGCSEQNPANWILAAESVLDALKSSHPTQLSAVSGIGLSGQMHGATVLDQSGKVLRPCILWNDTRSHVEAAKLDADPSFHQISGNIVFPGFTAPKLVWMKQNEPKLFAEIHKVLLPKDYLRFWLTGNYVSDMSDAAGTAWLDTGSRSWSQQLLTASGMSIEQMPDLVEGTEVSGRLRHKLAVLWGMEKSVVVAGGAGDNAASAIGTGTVDEGSAFVSLGTSGVLFAANSEYLPNPQSAVHAFCHAMPNTWHQMGVILSAASALDWFAKLVGSKANLLVDSVGDQLLSPTDVTFLPYLSGERTPHNDASIRGALIGVAHESDREALTRAVLEGVAFALRDNLDALRSTGTEIQNLTVVGGGAKAIYWLKLIATILDLPVSVPAEGDYGAAFGAARLGLIATTNGDPNQVCYKPVIAQIIEPEISLQSAFESAYVRYRGFY